MADTHAPGTGSAGIDLSQFYQVFFEEAGENLATMEQMLLNLDLAHADDEELNAIFRCAHSVKGGAATFGFADVAELTHQMETLLDKLRRHELEPQTRMVDVLLAAGDALKAQLARHQGAGGAEVDTRVLIADIEELAAGVGVTAPTTAAAAPAGAPVHATAPTAPPAERLLELTVGPLPDPAVADNLLELFKEIAELGTMEPLDAGHSADGMRRFKIATQSSDGDLLDLFTFHVPRESLRLGPLTRGYGFHRNAPGAPKEEPDDQGYGFFADAPGAPRAGAPAPAAARADTARAPALPGRPTARRWSRRRCAYRWTRSIS
jgi:two-component system chemotaxis sensor kinase CheA